MYSVVVVVVVSNTHVSFPRFSYFLFLEIFNSNFFLSIFHLYIPLYYRYLSLLSLPFPFFPFHRIVDPSIHPFPSHSSLFLPHTRLSLSLPLSLSLFSRTCTDF